jgi:hypothetical protein
LMRFCHPALLVQCAQEPGPSLDQMTEFILAGLGWRAELPAKKRTEPRQSKANSRSV